MNKHTIIILLITFLFNPFFGSSTAWSHGVENNAYTYIISPENGSTVYSPVTIKFGIKNFKIAPVGQDIHNSGHYHLIIDQASELSMDDPIPYDEHHRHLDKGESEITLPLSPGRHTLQVVVGDEEHEPFEQLVSEKIAINVISNK
ncbi:MAG: DUF4399 domain-containing protein [Bacteroidota bacterium]